MTYNEEKVSTLLQSARQFGGTHVVAWILLILVQHGVSDENFCVSVVEQSDDIQATIFSYGLVQPTVGEKPSSREKHHLGRWGCVVGGIPLIGSGFRAFR